jgi:rubredoxin
MTNIQALRLFTNGGIITPEELRKITEVARLCSCSALMPGSRQEIYLQVENGCLPVAERELTGKAIGYAPVHTPLQNIVTSYAALQILPTTAWVSAGTYLDILDSFAYQPGLKINITDPLQNLVPLFTGELNFIASSYPRYWHLYINFPGFSRSQSWPVLIDGEDIAPVSGLIEKVYAQQHPQTIQDLYTAVSGQFTARSPAREEELHLPVHPFPVTEGMHACGSSCWLGIYRRNQAFSVSFLEALYRQCIESKIGKICLTPHKTLLIKDIKPEERLCWEKLLGIHHIQLQHSALELNWQLPDLDTGAIQLKNTWVRELEEKEVYTTGLSFALQTRPADVFTSVAIRQNTEAGQTGYDILHTADFTGYSSKWQVFAGSVPGQAVADALIDLCQVYYRQLGTTSVAVLAEETPVFAQTRQVHQCPDCLTIYNLESGDPAANIPPGTSFEELPGTYTCSLCEAPKANFVQIESSLV